MSNCWLNSLFILILPTFIIVCLKRFRSQGGAKHFVIFIKLFSKILWMELMKHDSVAHFFRKQKKIERMFIVHPFFVYRKMTWVIIADCCSCSSFLLDFFGAIQVNESGLKCRIFCQTKFYMQIVNETLRQVLQRNPRESDENSAHFCFEILLISKWGKTKQNWKWKTRKDFVIRFISFLLFLSMTQENYL